MTFDKNINEAQRIIEEVMKDPSNLNRMAVARLGYSDMIVKFMESFMEQYNKFKDMPKDDNGFDEWHQSVPEMAKELEIVIKEIKRWPELTDCMTSSLFSIGEIIGFAAASIMFRYADIKRDRHVENEFMSLLRRLTQNPRLKNYIEIRMAMKGLR